MDDHLSRLENKVLEAIDLNKELRRENGELKSRCTDLENRLTQSRDEREKMQRELTESRELASQAELFEEKRRVIENKVGSLLERLEAMD